MKALTSLTFNAFLLTTAALALAAPDRARTASRQTTNAPWNVRVAVLMVAMPQDKLLPLLPDFRDPKKIEGVVAQLLAAINRKEAVLTGYPVLNAVDGKRGETHTSTEKRYPTEFQPPPERQPKAAPAPAPPADAGAINDIISPAAFETRNCGVILEAEPHVSSHGDSVQLDLDLQRVELLGVDTFDATRTASGKIVKIEQPQFLSIKTLTSVAVQNGQHTLLGVHILPKPENFMEVFIIQASATPIK